MIEKKMTDIELQEKLASIEKLQAEIHKLLIDATHAQKRNKWIEFAIMLGVIAATITVTKLYL